MHLVNDMVPMNWWSDAPNFGDLLAPWLVEKMSGKKPFAEADRDNKPNYLVIGSIVSHARDASIVWGPGSFGDETNNQLNKSAEYLAVRGPLTRNKLAIAGINCPRVYGDPALLVPDFYQPKSEKTHEIGVVVRWSEPWWNRDLKIDGVKTISLKSDDIEGVLEEIHSCKRIISSSLHGLIIADAFGIPNAWLASGSPRGLEFKFWDYFLTVQKPRPPRTLDLAKGKIDLNTLLNAFDYDDRPMGLDLDPLRKANPFGWVPPKAA